MCLLFSCWPLFVSGQVTTGFESGLGGNWDQFPVNRWESSPDKPVSGLYSLHHSYDNASSGTDKISFETGTFDWTREIRWEFSLRYDYTPSSSNKWEVFLAADKSASTLYGSGIVNGYVLGVNVAGSDDTLRLYSVQEGKLLEISGTSLNYEKDIGSSVFHCVVSRDPLTGWKVYASKQDSALGLIGATLNGGNVFPILKHFMLSYTYTSAKDRLLWLDDLLIDANYFVDTIPPEISGYKIQGNKTITVELSEEIDAGFLQKEQFQLLPGNVSPEKVVLKGKSIACTFRDRFEQRAYYQLFVNNLTDLEGNVSVSDSIGFLFYQAEKNDIVFTEIMADPSPAVYLPESEYLELYNRSEFPLNVDSFILQTGKKEWLLPDIALQPSEYYIITTAGTTGENVIPLFSSSSVITNDGSQLFLKDKYGEILTATEFDTDWYDDEFKSQGGWSLERVDADNLCGGKENWKASVDISGGTPGLRNSVQALNPDTESPFIESIGFISEMKIMLTLNESIDPQTIPAPDSFRVSGSSVHVDSVVFNEFFCKSIEVVFKSELLKGAVYQLIVSDGITDCSSNRLKNSSQLYFGLPESAKHTDIIISELLFSALPGCPEFIELYNQSDHLLDLSDIRVSVGNKGEINATVIPVKTPVLFFPGTFLVICRDKAALLSCFEIENGNNIIEVEDLPSFPDEGACVGLKNRSLETVDEFCYDSDNEFPMLSVGHGVSLERLRLDRKTGNQSLWHSASSVAGFGTPGKANSQSLSDFQEQRRIEVSPEVFSPDNDGEDDFLGIHYTLEKEGFVGTVVIFDPSGRKVRYLGENELLGTSGMFLWDGRDDTGNVCSTGLYLVYMEFWNLKGVRERFKKGVVLVRK